MTKLLSDIVIHTSRNGALLDLDMDTNAERFTVINRRSLIPIYSGIRPPSSRAKVLLPIEYATAGYCIVGIIDDSGVYNCKFVDGVQLQLVDATTVNMSQ